MLHRGLVHSARVRGQLADARQPRRLTRPMPTPHPAKAPSWSTRVSRSAPRPHPIQAFSGLVDRDYATFGAPNPTPVARDAAETTKPPQPQRQEARLAGLTAVTS